MSDDVKRGTKPVEAALGEAIRYACSRSFGVIDQTFLCSSLGVLNPESPVAVRGNENLGDVVARLKQLRIGCVVVVDDTGKLCGIFSERDLVLKVEFGSAAALQHEVSRYMTPEPVAAGMDTTLAYALNLMSQGGFRHLPIIDEQGMPIGIVSIKDVVDHLVARMVDDLLGFEAAS